MSLRRVYRPAPQLRSVFACLLGGLLVAANLSLAVAQPGPFRSLPPEGIDVADETITELRQAIARVREQLTVTAAAASDAANWRPDVEVFIRGVELAIDQRLFYKPNDVETAARMLNVATQRIEAAGRGLRGVELLAIGSRGDHRGRTLAGGFVSRIDGSVQPYGLVLPAGFTAAADTPAADATPTAADDDPGAPARWRLDVWLHGRGDKTTELPFLNDRLSKLGAVSPADTLVLHPFGRHCNAFKFAGETDVYEAIEHVSGWLPADPARTSIRGFSMGGAGCWHLAAHNPARWFAANPGAGFVDTVRYQGWQDGWPYPDSDWGRALMNWYDVPPWVDNLSNTHVIAYSGEIDKQRAAAEIMLQAATAADVDVEHVIGAGMGHKIDEDSAKRIDRRLAEWAEQSDGGYRPSIRLVTYTLRYHRIDWLSVEGMKQHWQRAAVNARWEAPGRLRITAENADRLRIDFTRLGWPLDDGPTRIEINGQAFAGEPARRGQPWMIDLIERDGQWYELDSAAGDESLRKRPGLQGPIDDALTGPFLFVLPSRPCRHGAVERFVQREIEQARRSWRRVMRGDDRAVLDTELTAEQIASYNLVCFGDFESNRYLASIAAELPIRWQADEIKVGATRHDAAGHALAMIFPNPQNRDRYVVVNSGQTFREFSHTTNSRQIAMLPDWAVIDVTTPPDGVFPGRIVAADFFNENWQVAANPQPR